MTEKKVQNLKKELQDLKEEVAVLDEGLLLERVQKVIGNNSSVKKIVSKLKSDKVFMEKFKKVNEAEQIALLKNRLKDEIEEINKKLSERKKEQVANALKGLVTAITSVRWQWAKDTRFVKLPKQVQQKIRYYVEANARKNNKNWIRVPGFKLSLDFGKDIPLVEKNSMTFVVNPYVITGIFKYLRKVVSINVGKTNVFEGRIRGGKEKQKANALNVQIKKMKPEQQALWILSEWLNLKESVLLELVKKNGILNKLYEAVLEYIEIYKGWIEEWDKKIKENIKEDKGKKAPINVILSTKFDDLNNTNYSRRYQWSYYGSALIVWDTKYIYGSKVKDKKYSWKPEYVKETMKNMVKYLWSLKYKNIDGKIKRVFDALELAWILNKVLAELKQTGDIEDFKPIDTDKLKGVKKVIDKFKKALSKDTEVKVTIDKDNIVSIKWYKQLKKKYWLTQDITKENLNKWIEAIKKELREENIDIDLKHFDIDLKHFYLNDIEFIINDDWFATISLWKTKITKWQMGVTDDGKALEFIGEYVNGKDKGEIHLLKNDSNKVQQLLELYNNTNETGKLEILYVLLLVFIELIFASDTNLINQIAKTASSVKVKEEVDTNEENDTKKENVSKDIVASTWEEIQNKVETMNKILDAQI